jgi:hypothetical protein
VDRFFLRFRDILDSLRRLSLVRTGSLPSMHTWFYKSDLLCVALHFFALFLLLFLLLTPIIDTCISNHLSAPHGLRL